MSVNDEQTKNLEEEVVVNEITTVVEDPEMEAKKAKAIGVAKKVGKVAAVIGVGALGFFLGSKASRKSEYNDSDIIEGEIIDSDIE